MSQRNLRALYNAIVDSGASGIYASKGEPHVTKIGDVTESRLCSFDLEALAHHARRVAVAAG